MDPLDQHLTDAGAAWRRSQPEPPDLDRLVAGLGRPRSRVWSPRLAFVLVAGLILLGAVAAAGVGGIFQPVPNGLSVTPTLPPPHRPRVPAGRHLVPAKCRTPATNRSRAWWRVCNRAMPSERQRSSTATRRLSSPASGRPLSTCSHLRARLATSASRPTLPSVRPTSRASPVDTRSVLRLNRCLIGRFTRRSSPAPI